LSSPTADITCSCSIGISERRPDDEGLDSMLRRADAALYQAKRSGRNCWRSNEHEQAHEGLSSLPARSID
jgi:PleD family two-component response regulator